MSRGEWGDGLAGQISSASVGVSPALVGQQRAIDQMQILARQPARSGQGCHVRGRLRSSWCPILGEQHHIPRWPGGRPMGGRRLPSGKSRNAHWAPLGCGSPPNGPCLGPNGQRAVSQWGPSPNPAETQWTSAPIPLRSQPPTSLGLALAVLPALAVPTLPKSTTLP